MNNYEKAMSGYVFKRGNEVLAEKRMRAKDLCFRYNSLLPSDAENRTAVMDELLNRKGENCLIISPFFCDYGEFIAVGDNFFMNYNCKILDGGKVTFGNDVLVGPDCTFVTPSHPLDPGQRLEGLEIFLPVTVGNNVWFGAGVTVLGGVTIGDNTVIAAGSVVTRDIPANCLAAGVPCRVIREVNEKDGDKYPFCPE